MQTRNFNGLDISKFFMAFMIIILHFDPIDQNGAYRYPILFLPVPIFFIISSFLFFRKDYSSRKPLRFVKRNLILYFVYFFLFLPLYRSVYISMFDEGLLSGLLSFTRNFFFYTTFRNSWFIMSLVIGVLIVHYSSKIHKSFPIVLGAFSYILCVFETTLYNLVVPDSLLSYVYEWYPTYMVYSFPLGVAWCSIGYLAVHIRQLGGGTLMMLILILLSTMSLAVEYNFYKSLSIVKQPVYCFSMLPLCLFIFLWMKNHLKSLPAVFFLITCRKRRRQIHLM